MSAKARKQAPLFNVLRCLRTGVNIDTVQAAKAVGSLMRGFSAERECVKLRQYSAWINAKPGMLQLLEKNLPETMNWLFLAVLRKTSKSLFALRT